MNNLEKLIKNNYSDIVGENVESKIFDIIGPTESKLISLEKNIAQLKDIIDQKVSRLNEEIKIAENVIKNTIAKKYNESTLSRLYIQDLKTNKLITDDTSIYGTNSGESETTGINLEKIDAKYITANSTKNASVYINNNIVVINPIESNSEIIECDIDIKLKNKESVFSLILDTKTPLDVNVYTKDKDGVFIHKLKQKSSYIYVSINDYIDTIKLKVKIKETNKEIYFNNIKILRSVKSQDTYHDIDFSLQENASSIELLRCDSGNKNIEYLLSANGRVFKNATESPIDILGVEDGSIIVSRVVSSLKGNNEDFRVYSTELSQEAINSNLFTVFYGKNRVNRIHEYGIDRTEFIAIYKDIYSISIPANTIVYINENKVSGKIYMYPGVYNIRVYENKQYDFDIYKKAEYDGKTLTLTTITDGKDKIQIVDNVFAQIDSSASHIFSGKINSFSFLKSSELIVKEQDTKENILFIGYKPISSTLTNVKIRILFKSSNKTASISHIALKVF